MTTPTTPPNPNTTHEDSLTPRQLRFVQEYCVDLNATNAYLRAGYDVASLDVASVNASRLLANAKVRLAVAQRLAAIDARLGLSAERTARENGWIAHSTILDVAEITRGDLIVKDSSTWTPAAAAAVQSVSKTERYGRNGEVIGSTLTVKLHAKGEALERQMKHQNMFREHQEATGTGLAAAAYAALLEYDRTKQQQQQQQQQHLPAPAGAPAAPSIIEAAPPALPPGIQADSPPAPEAEREDTSER